MKNCVTANRLGFWCSSAPVGFGSAHALALAAGFARWGIWYVGMGSGMGSGRDKYMISG